MTGSVTGLGAWFSVSSWSARRPESRHASKQAPHLETQEMRCLLCTTSCRACQAVSGLREDASGCSGAHVFSGGLLQLKHKR